MVYGPSLLSFYQASFTLSTLIGAAARQEAESQLKLAKGRYGGFFNMSRFKCEGYRSEEEMRLTKMARDMKVMQSQAQSIKNSMRKQNSGGRREGGQGTSRNGGSFNRNRGFQKNSRGGKRPARGGSAYWLAGNKNV